MLPSAIATKLLTDSGALLTDGHFVLVSKRHSSVYLNKARLTWNPLITESICELLAHELVGNPVQAVVTPAVGAIPLGQSTAKLLIQLTRDMVYSAYAEKDGEGFTLKRGYENLIRGLSVAVVEDVLTTGTSTKKVMDAVQACGGEVTVVAAICNRGGVTAADLGVPTLVSLMDLNLPTWDEGQCELCSAGIPVDPNIGHGAAFLARQT